MFGSSPDHPSKSMQEGDSGITESSSDEPNAKNFSQLMSVPSGFKMLYRIPFKAIINYDITQSETKRSDKNNFHRKFKYDPALALMGLGKRFPQYDPALKYMGLGKRQSKYDPALKYMGLGKRDYAEELTENIEDGSRNEKIDDYDFLEDISNDDFSAENDMDKRQDKYDPAIMYMGLGKRNYPEDSALKPDKSDNSSKENKDNGSSEDIPFSEEIISNNEVEKRQERYDPALKYMGLGKRKSHYDPALKYMGLGKRKYQFDPALKYMGLGKRKFQYDPAIKYMGLGKRSFEYDPAMKYMGLGKRKFQYDPAMKYMGLGKRKFQYDPAIIYMGLGKRESQFDPGMKYMGLGKRNSQFDPGMKYMGLGKRSYQFDPGMAYMGLGKRNFQFDPGMKYMGLGKRNSQFDPAMKYMGLGKRNYQFDPGMKYMGLGKRNSQFDPGMKYMGLGKRSSQFDPGMRYMGLGKRNPQFDPGMKYMGLGKRNYIDESNSLNVETSLDDSRNESSNEQISTYDEHSTSRLKKRSYNYRLSTRYPSISKWNFEDSLNKVPGLGKRPYKFDPALRLMGLGKRNDQKMYDQKSGKRAYKVDPSLKYMGLGKREQDFHGDSNVINYSLSANMDEMSPMSSKQSQSLKFKDTNDNTKESEKSFDMFTHDLNVLLKGLDKREKKEDPMLFYIDHDKYGKMYNDKFYNTFGDNGESIFDIVHDSVSLNNPPFSVSSDKRIMTDIKNAAEYPNKAKDCGNKCVRRIKRDLLHADSDLGTADSGDKILETVTPILKTWRENSEVQFTHQQKRERDNRPKYNPGWIFIGLGKRDEIEEDHSSSEKNKHNIDRDEVTFNNYYRILDKLQNEIQDINFDVGDKVGQFYLLPESKKENVKYKFPYGINPDEFIWSKPTIPRVSLVPTSENLVPDTWLDFVPSITRIRK